jgi:hypothetical protein
MARAQDKLDRLRTVQPFLIDLSLCENPVGARVGQTLKDKLDLLPLGGLARTGAGQGEEDEEGKTRVHDLDRDRWRRFVSPLCNQNTGSPLGIVAM